MTIVHSVATPFSRTAAVTPLAAAILIQPPPLRTTTASLRHAPRTTARPSCHRLHCRVPVPASLSGQPRWAGCGWCDAGGDGDAGCIFWRRLRLPFAAGGLCAACQRCTRTAAHRNAHHAPLRAATSPLYGGPIACWLLGVTGRYRHLRPGDGGARACSSWLAGGITFFLPVNNVEELCHDLTPLYRYSVHRGV